MDAMSELERMIVEFEKTILPNEEQLEKSELKYDMIRAFVFSISSSIRAACESRLLVGGGLENDKTFVRNLAVLNAEISMIGELVQPITQFIGYVIGSSPKLMGTNVISAIHSIEKESPLPEYELADNERPC